MAQNKPMFPSPRKVVSGDTWVTVIEDEGQLVAIVKDKMHGLVRIPLGRAQPALRRSC